MQDTDKYDSKQANVSGGASFIFGSMTGSASLSVSQDKIKSNFESVQEQTGLYAGKGGYQVSVGDHAQLNGAVIASTAEANKNAINTGTLGWTDLTNQADFSAQHESVSGSTSGKDGGMFTGSMGSVLLVGASHSGSDSSTTYSAISDGQLTIRNTGEQQQDVANLSHDVEHANHALSPIFDKEKEQNRLREAQLIGDIGNQAMDIIRTQGAIDAANAQKDPAAIAAARDKLIAEGNTYPSTEDIAKQITNTVMQQYGTGSDYQRAAQAVTAALQGLAGGNIAQALTGAAAPYLAEQIKKMTADSPEANLMAHALLGAAVAAAKNASAAAGAIGASGELAARYIRQQLYGTDDNEALTEQQKQTISALSTLAAGLAGAIIGGDAASSLTAAQTGKNAVDNNELSLSPGWLQFGQSSTTLAEFMRLNGATPDEISDATRALAGGVGSGAPQPANGFINAWMAYVGIEALGLGVVGLIGKFSAGLAEGTVVAYRVEGTPNARLLISDDGQVLIQGDENIISKFRR